jgi:NTP pyrophosphatase (non-canonical NTP hydrolase)
MNINDYIKDLSIKDKKTLSQKTLKLVEEVGELSRVILPYDSAHGTNHRFTDRDAILEELVDVYLTNVSISHSLGFTDEEFNDMLVKKSEKWGSLQVKEEKATFPLPFEIHVTVEVDLPVENGEVVNNWYGTIEEFKEDCNKIGVKPIVIDLEINDGSILKDVMTSSKFFGDNRGAYEESERICKELRNRGYKVVRNKIETVPWHPAAPQDKDKDHPLFHGEPIPNGCYFESHIGIIISQEEKEDLNELVDFLNESICEFSGTAKLSRNFFKRSESGKFVNMLTYRSNMVTCKEFESEVRSIEKIISGKNDWSLLSNFKKFDYEKVEIEYAVYDTNVTHDAKWIYNEK